MNNSLDLRGRFEVECRNPDGSLAWMASLPNGIATAGITDLLSAGFAGGAQRTWYLGLINNSGYSALSPSDTMSSHAGWSELSSYSAGTRPAWSLSVNGGVAASSAAAAFTASGDVSVRGMFLSSNSTKGGTTGILWSTALFGSARTLLSGQTLNVNYTLRASGGAG